MGRSGADLSFPGTAAVTGASRWISALCRCRSVSKMLHQGSVIAQRRDSKLNWYLRLLSHASIEVEKWSPCWAASEHFSYSAASWSARWTRGSLLLCSYIFMKIPGDCWCSWNTPQILNVRFCDVVCAVLSRISEFEGPPARPGTLHNRWCHLLQNWIFNAVCVFEMCQQLQLGLRIFRASSAVYLLFLSR